MRRALQNLGAMPMRTDYSDLFCGPEFESTELCYRRGLHQGAYYAYKRLCDGENPDQVREWIDIVLHRWRLEGMKKLRESGRVKRVLPPGQPRSNKVTSR
jgi:hypothetical protein